MGVPGGSPGGVLKYMDETFDSFSLHAHFEKKLQHQDIQWILSYAAAMFFF